MAKKPWRVIPRPLLETVLNNHAQRHRVHQPLIFHGPRGTGKTTLILDRLLGEWNKGPHVAGYVDFAECVGDHHPRFGHSFPWSSWSSCPRLPHLSDCRAKLEACLESMAHSAVRLGLISSRQVFSALDKWHGLGATTLARIAGKSPLPSLSRLMSKAVLWDRAVFAMCTRCNADEVEGILSLGEKGLSVEEASYYREAVAALRLAKEVIELQRGWRASAIKDLNQRGGFSRSLANSCTDWPCLLLELLSEAAEIGHFQPKLVINNIEVLRLATLSDGDLSVSAPLYHDSLIWRIIALGANEKSLPVIFVTSDSYYSYRAYLDFGFIDIFISRETTGWTAQEAKLHMVTDYFNDSERRIITEVLGPNPRHLFELYALKQSNDNGKTANEKGGTIEDIVDAYLAYLQISVVNPAMDQALKLLQKFAADAQSGKIPEDKLRFGAPWRHPPRKNDTALQLEWAKIQLMDFVQSLVKADFGLNYLADCSLEIFDDPSAVALMEVGLLYAQRDPSFIRPVSKGIERCIVRWLVQERIQMSSKNVIQYRWQRFMRGRSYRHLLLQLGYK